MDNDALFSSRYFRVALASGVTFFFFEREVEDNVRQKMYLKIFFIVLLLFGDMMW